MSWRVEWRCACRDSGGQCVMTSGIPEMQRLSADSLVSPQNVRNFSASFSLSCYVVTSSIV